MTGDSHYNILLPEASIVIYSDKKQNCRAVEALSDDWRFARVSIQSRHGDVKDAIEDCKSGHSPTLLIIQSAKINEAFANALEDLAQHCAEGTGAIIVGPDNDVDLYRRLVDMGISDYLVHPLKIEIVGDVIAKALIQELGTKDSHLMSFIGTKGGVGTTSLCAAMALGISKYVGQKTVLLDGSGGWSPFNVSMGIEPSASLLEAAEAAAAGDEDSLTRMLQSVSPTLDVLACETTNAFDRPVTPDQLETLHDMLMARYPYVITDLSDSSAGIRKVILNKSHQIGVVSIPTIPALRQARTLLSDIAELRGDNKDGISLIINMQGMSGVNEISTKDIEEAVDQDVSACIRFLPKLFIGSESEGKNLIENSDGAAIIRDQLLPLVTQDEIEAAEESGFFNTLIQSIKAG